MNTTNLNITSQNEAFKNIAVKLDDIIKTDMLWDNIVSSSGALGTGKTYITTKMDDLSMQQLRDWADENNISNEVFPRGKNELLILEELDLGGDDLECECLNYIPKEIGLLSSLTSLSFCIDGNDIPTLPESIGNLINLHTLIISVCGSSCKGRLQLPKAVSNLNKLKLIGLTGNISTDSIELLLEEHEYLERLFIDNNQLLKTLPKNISDCSSIKELILINNRNLLLTPKQFDWAENLRDDEKGYDRVYCTELADGTSVSYTTDYGQKFQFYCIIPFDRAIKIYEPNFPSKEELF